MNELIHLNRSFTSLVINHANSSNSEIELQSAPLFQWGDVIDSKRAIILAEAGSGKTTEIKEQTKNLIKNGNYAFFLRLESLIDDFDGAFYSDLSNKNLFDEWCEKSNEEGYFFLDSVDESKIRSGRDFHKAINNFSRKTLRYLNRCNIYITSRTSAWQPNTDLQFICNELSISKRLDEFQVFSMQPLSSSQIKYYANNRGVTSVDDFISEVGKNEFNSFASRPLDLDELISHWNKNLTLGNRAELLKGSIEQKLNKADRSKDFTDLSYEKENEGIEILASANVFCQQTNLELADTIVFTEGLSVRKVLATWSQKEIDTLLSRPIFEPSQYGTVRFYNVIAREFLTAKFLWRNHKSGKIKKEDIEKIFFCDIYGTTVLRHSLRPIFSWYLIYDKTFYDLVESIAPEIFLQGGDPSSLSTDLRIKIIESYCENYDNYKTANSTFDENSLIRFCTSQLSDTINNLLNKYKKNNSILQLLLKMAISCDGKNSTTFAKSIFEGGSNNYQTKISALNLIENDISTDEFKVYINHHLAIQKYSSGFLASIISYFPTHLNIESLIAALSQVHYKNDISIKFSSESFFKSLHEDSLELAFYKLSDLITKKPYDDNRVTRISKDHYWLSESVSIVMLRLISKRLKICSSDLFLDILSRLESRCDNYSRKDTEAKIKKEIMEWPNLNDDLFWYDIEHTRNEKRITFQKSVTHWFQANNLDNFWTFSEKDLARVISWLEIKKDDNIFVCISLAYHIISTIKNSSSSASNLDLLKSKADGFDDCNIFLNNLIHPQKLPSDIALEERQQEWKIEAEQRRKKDEINNANSLKNLKKDISVIRNIDFANEGLLNQAQLYLLQKLLSLDGNQSHWGSYNWKLLEDEFGIEIAREFRDAAVSYWRKYTGTILRDGDSIPTSRGGGFIFAMSGLGMEYEQDELWAKNLSIEEATKACLFGFAELNNCSKWLESIEKHHPDIFYKILVNEIKWEITSENSDYYVLNFIISNNAWLKKSLSSYLFVLLKDTEPTLTKKLDLVIRILLSNIDDTNIDDLSKLASMRYILAIEDDRKAIWLSTLIRCNPGEGINELTNELSNNTNKERNCNFAMLTLTSLYYEETFNRATRDISNLSPKHLCEILILMYQHISEHEDIHREGGVSFRPGLRDHAQDARNRLVEILGSMSGYDAFIGLQQLAKIENLRPWRKEQFEHLALGIAARDAELPAWGIEHFSDFINSINKEPIMTTNNINQNFNLSVGDNNSGNFTVGNINISSLKENKNEINKELLSLIKEIEKSTDFEEKEKAIKQLSTIHEELNEQTPDVGIIKGYLNKAGELLTNLNKGSDIAISATTLFSKIMLLLA
ncbi:TPA: NACHT domain-containing protein [Serratia fonticola]